MTYPAVETQPSFPAVEQRVLAAWQARDDGFRLHFGVEPDKASQLLTEEGAHVRAFVGYSGWSAGQLENELRRSSWIAARPQQDLLGLEHDRQLWSELLGQVSPLHRILAEAPDDPSLN